MGNGQGKPVNFDDDVNLNHFRLLRVVGKGAFGKVRIVERKDTNLTFALKYIRKDEVVRSESVRNIIRERRMLENLHHCFICNLRYSFQDIEYMYLVVDLMNGGDLRFHISRKTFTEEAVRFWIAELGCALKYIHSQGIIHRDVKPDNVLLDSEGHIHLADFNVASDYTPGKALTSKSGTLAYLAPEVYKGTGYGPGADWWSLGVLFYECIYNKRPFEGTTQTALSAKIAGANPKFPVTSPAVSMPCLHAISSALEEDPSKRMGSASFYSFTDNPFFRAIDFQALERKQIEPVFIPSSEKTNFDATYDLEELLLEEAPLEARARRQKPREQLKDDATEKEVREEELYKMIEAQFSSFNYTKGHYDRFRDGIDPNTSTSFASQQDIRQGEAQHGHTPSGSIDEPAGSPSTHRSFSRSNRRRKNSSKSVPPSPDRSSISGCNGPLPSPPRSHPRQPPAPTTANRPPNYPPPSRQNTTSPIPYAQSYDRSQRPTGTRNQSVGGGMQVTLDETGSWSALARQDATLPADAVAVAEEGKPAGGGGMLGFLRGKRGRDRSPKPQERGILGKEGARIVISG